MDITPDDVADETAEAPAAEEAAPAEETAPAEEAAPVEEPTVDDVVADVRETVAEVTEEAPLPTSPRTRSNSHYDRKNPELSKKKSSGFFV